MNLSEFEDAYAGVLMRSWTSEDFTTELLAKPAQALREFNLVVPDGVTITVIRHSEGDGTTQDQFQRWNDGIAAGHIDLVVPEVAPVDIGEVSDAELAGMPGGSDVCCCCCPCCTCTA